MTSVVHYRWSSAKASDVIQFNGVSIRLIDLKRAIIDRKGLASGRGMDFELEVKDEDTQKVYTSDDALVPKNSNVVAKRVPAIGGKGVLSRLRQQGHQTTAARPAPIVVQAKVEPPPPAATAAVAQPPSTTAPVTTSSSQDADDADELKVIQALQASDSERNKRGNKVWVSGDVRQNDSNSTANAKRAPVSSVPPPNYVCHRCGRPGHLIQHCPTNNDPNFNKKEPAKPQQRMLGVPVTHVKKVADLTEVDTRGKLVINTKDGFEVVEPSEHLFEDIVKRGGGASTSTVTTAIRDADIPEHLRCPFSHKLLRNAVLLPCCHKSVDDESIRTALLNSEFKCPLCGTEGVEPDSLTPQLSLRASVEEFLRKAHSEGKPDHPDAADGERVDETHSPQSNKIADAPPRMPFESQRPMDHPAMPFDSDMRPPMMPPYFGMGPMGPMGMMPPPDHMGMPWMDPMMDPMMMMMGMPPMGMGMGMPPMMPMGMPPFMDPMGMPMSEDEFMRRQEDMRRRGGDRRRRGPEYSDRGPGRDGSRGRSRDADRPRAPDPNTSESTQPIEAGQVEDSATPAAGETQPKHVERSSRGRESRDQANGYDSRDRNRRDRDRERDQDRRGDRRDDRRDDKRDDRRARDDSRRRDRPKRSRSRERSSSRRELKRSRSVEKAETQLESKEQPASSTAAQTSNGDREKDKDRSRSHRSRDDRDSKKYRSRSRERRRSPERDAKRSRRDKEREKEPTSTTTTSAAERTVRSAATSVDRRTRDKSPANGHHSRDNTKDREKNPERNGDRDKDRNGEREKSSDKSSKKSRVEDRDRWPMERT